MRLFLSIVLLALLFMPNISIAKTYIHDSEIESVLNRIIHPILTEAGLSPDGVTIYIVNDSTVNAYVSGGMNIFINTGLITLSEDMDMFAGVMAHEVGHIKAGHLFESYDAAKSATIQSTIGYILGIGAMALGSPEAAGALMSGGVHVANRNFLSHTRSNEEEADKIAAILLKKLNYSTSGLMRLLEYLNNNEKLLYEASTPYTRTHPLNRNRIEFLRGTITEDNIDERKELRKDYAMIYTKLKSYLQNSDVTLKQYPDSDKSKKARYARVIAYYKLPNIDKSLAELDSLIKDEAKNPYFYELKGQILFENGRDGAVATYGIALSLRPNDPLIQVQLAQAKIEVGGKKNIEQAIIHLEQALNSNRKNPFALHQLAIAHGRSGNVGLSHLYLAEEALMLNKLDDVKTYLGLAKKNIELTPVTEIRMNDIERSLERKEK